MANPVPTEPVVITVSAAQVDNSISLIDLLNRLQAPTPTALGIAPEPDAAARLTRIGDLAGQLAAELQALSAHQPGS